MGQPGLFVRSSDEIGPAACEIATRWMYMIIARASAKTTTQCRARVGFNIAVAAFCSDSKRADGFDDIGSFQSLSARDSG